MNSLNFNIQILPKDTEASHTGGDFIPWRKPDGDANVTDGSPVRPVSHDGRL